jgi:hypothetical protein
MPLIRPLHGPGTRSPEGGAALLVVLVTVVVVTLSGALAHRAAMDTLRHARTGLAALRAREAATAGLTSVMAGGPLTGTLPGGASWAVTVLPTAGNDLLLHATGTSSLPYPASAEILAVTDSSGQELRARVRLWR